LPETRRATRISSFYSNASVAMRDTLASSNQPALRFRRTIMSSAATDLLTNAPRSRTINGTVQAFRQQP
jgi:hypothetical protein